MKKLYLFLCVLMIAATQCTKEATPVYWDKPYVEISRVQTGRIDFFVPDQGDSGWDFDDPGVDTVIVEFNVRNLSDVGLSLSGIFYGLYALDGWIFEDGDEIVPPFILGANDSTVIQVHIEITEFTAHLVDYRDGLEDFTGTGTFMFWMTGYDNERYEDIGSNIIYSEMSVAKPSK
jgi:hypothetical protein